MKLNGLALITGLFLLAGSAQAEKAMAKLDGTAAGSKLNGMILLEDTDVGLKIIAHVEKAPAGKHGFHIHEFGTCENSGNAAGSHYNPQNTTHGHAVKDGLKKAHPGDLGNIEVGPDGMGHLEITIADVTLAKGSLTVAGRAVVLHEKADDFGQPTGNAGGRIGCGTIVITGQ